MFDTGIVNKLFAIVFVILAAFMLMLGASLLVSWPSNQIEWLIVLMALGASFFLFWGAKQTLSRAKKQQAAEHAEDLRIKKDFPVKRKPAKSNYAVDVKNEPKKTITVASKPVNEHTPVILAQWMFTKATWKIVFKKVLQKTYKEEIYTAVWYPVFFGLLAWGHYMWGILAGVLFGLFYLWFRGYYVKNKFGAIPSQAYAEIIISDSYLRINGKYIHYADDKYFLKSVQQESDKEFGDLLHFDIGWFTSKDLPASMDLYVPIPPDKMHEARLILETFQKS